MTLLLIFSFIFGTIIGSFLNVVIYRINTGRSVVNDRSMCFSCGKQLYWYELVPVFSYLFQGGKCRKCKAKISSQYILVEILTGFVFTAILYFYFPTAQVLPHSYSTGPFSLGNPLIVLTIFSPILLILDAYYAAVWSILIVVLVYDLRHKIIPDQLAFLFAALSFIKLFINISPDGISYVTPGIWHILAGPILFLPFYLLWKLSDGKWMGLGDGKLALGIGWFLGLSYGISAIILGFWIGAVAGVLLIILQRIMRKSVFHRLALSIGIGERIMKSEIPFAPFLIIGIALAFFFRIDALRLAFLTGLQ